MDASHTIMSTAARRLIPRILALECVALTIVSATHSSARMRGISRRAAVLMIVCEASMSCGYRSPPQHLRIALAADEDAMLDHPCRSTAIGYRSRSLRDAHGQLSG